MSLRGLRDVAVDAYADGRRWGGAGSYEWLSAKADFAVDPDDERNAGIVDLDLAPRVNGS